MLLKLVSHVRTTPEPDEFDESGLVVGWPNQKLSKEDMGGEGVCGGSGPGYKSYKQTESLRTRCAHSRIIRVLDQRRRFRGVSAQDAGRVFIGFRET